MSTINYFFFTTTARINASTIVNVQKPIQELKLNTSNPMLSFRGLSLEERHQY